MANHVDVVDDVGDVDDVDCWNMESNHNFLSTETDDVNEENKVDGDDHEDDNSDHSDHDKDIANHNDDAMIMTMIMNYDE